MPNHQTKKSQPFYSERFCRYIHRYCYQPRLDGYDYCIRHILEDKTAPFRQCSFVHPSNKKRCTNAAPKSEKNERRDTILCPFHSKQALGKAKAPRVKKRTYNSPADLLKQLEHHCTLPHHDKTSDKVLCTNEKYSRTANEGYLPKSLSAPGAVEEETEPCLIENTSTRSIEADPEWLGGIPTCLRHAGVYTSKEILRIITEKLKHLQKSYCTELEFIQHKLQQNQKEYAAILRKELPKTSSSSELQSGIFDSKKLKSLMKYRRLSHREKMMRRRAEEKRAAVGFVGLKTNSPSCAYQENGKCEKNALLLSRFCKDHILSDPNQVMYKPCRLGTKENCMTPVLPFQDSCEKHIPKADEQILKMAAPLPLPDLPSTFSVQDPEHFLSLDEMSSTGFEVTPEFYFNTLDAGDESTESILSEDQAEIMEIEPISSKPPLDILCDSAKSDSDAEKF